MAFIDDILTDRDAINLTLPWYQLPDYTGKAGGSEMGAAAVISRGLLRSKQFRELSIPARLIYVIMTAEAGRKAVEGFRFSYNDFELYGLKEMTVRRAVKLLAEKGFIEIKLDTKTKYLIYSFSDRWQKG